MIDALAALAHAWFVWVILGITCAAIVCAVVYDQH